MLAQNVSLLKLRPKLEGTFRYLEFRGQFQTYTFTRPDNPPTLPSSASTAMNFSVAILYKDDHRQVLFETDTIQIGSAQCCDVTLTSDPSVAPVHCTITIKDDSRVEITNFDRSIVLNSGPRVHRGSTVVAPLPASFTMGDTQIQINDLETDYDLDFALSNLSTTRRVGGQAPGLNCVSAVAPGPSTLTAWLEKVGDLQKSAAGSRAFFKDAARTIHNPGGMDGCIILQPNENDQWSIVASHIPYPDCNISFRPDLVRSSIAQRQPIFHDGAQIAVGQSYRDSHTAVVCPVVDNSDKIIAVVYGFRTHHGTNNRIGACPLEVQFVRLIASSISAAMVRLEKEAEASRSRVLLEQALSPKVVRQLEVDPQILQGVTREVTVLFADLRDFSAISEQAGPKVTYQMLTDVMDLFSEIIAGHDGVVIDFYGDGISAFWNAPIEQTRHTLLAVQAGHDILAALPELNSIWESRLVKRLRAGIGIHCGDALVGNSGSSSRLKYGPQGATVNIASRLESVTKGLGVPMIVSKQVADKVSQHYHGRRLCQTQLSGMSEPLHLFKLIAKPVSASSLRHFEEYDQALELYERQEYTEAIAILCGLNIDMPDPASAYLLEQAMLKNAHQVDLRKLYDQKSGVSALTLKEA